MNRKHKIIVSVVGIFIILLALLGITYGYFLTRIVGNTEETSVYITTANLSIVYDDNSSQINAINIQPSNTAIYTKTFKVSNKGNVNVKYNVVLENVINNFVHDEDLKFYITCVSNKGTVCNGYGDQTTIYPTENSILITNNIIPDDTTTTEVDYEEHTYTLYLQFLDDGTDQSDDMDKILGGKIQIYDADNIVTLTGTVDVTDTTKYYVELHSDVKTSQLSSDGTYIFFLPSQEEEHNLYVKYYDNNGTIQTVGEATSINVSKGEEASINSAASDIVFNDTVLSANVNISVDTSENTFTLSSGGLNKTLASTIIENSATSSFIKTTNIKTEGNKTVYYYSGSGAPNNVVFGRTNQKYCMYDGEMVYDGDVPVTNEIMCKSAKVCLDDEQESDGDYNTLIEEGCLERGGTLSDGYAEMQYASILWKIVRVNEDGSVRLFYNSLKEDILKDASDNPIAYNDLKGDSFSYTPVYGNAAVGYMYGLTNPSSNLVGACLTYDSSNNSVVDSTSTYTDENTCSSNGGTWVTSPYEATHANIANSNAKIVLDTWFKNNLYTVSAYLADAGFCNDRSINDSDEIWCETDTKLGYGIHNATHYGAYNRFNNNQLQYKCPNTNDLFTTKTANIGNKALTYPIGLISVDEYKLSNGAVHMNGYDEAVTMSPCYYSGGENLFFATWGCDYTDRDIGYAMFFPVINISSTVIIHGGTGSSSDPYILK